VSKRRRVDPGALRRDLRRHQSAGSHRLRDAVFVWGPLLVAALEVGRVATAPIEGTTAWFDGVLVGLGAGAAGAASWWFLATRRTVLARALAGVASVAMVLALFTSSGRKGQSMPVVTNAYLAGAVTYGAIGLAGMTVLLLQMRRGRVRGF
jgi:hypothetical protein